MSSNLCSQLGLFDRIHDFVVASANGELTEDHWARFEHLLQESDDACRLYLQYVEVSDLLQPVLDAIANEDSPAVDVFALEPQDSTAPTFPATLFHSTIGFFSSGWPLAYLIATVILGIGLLISSLIPASDQQQIAKRPSLPSRVDSELTTRLVGGISGMVDCKWSDVSTEAFNGTRVPLGRKYALASGLLEITYDSGAKIILQGPVTYEVESGAGGFLSVGKLTARVEKEVASGQWPVASNSEISSRQPLAPSPSSNPQSLIPNPLFVVRTPTAVVTDLGTEFGVEVSRLGTTSAHVFRGVVEVQMTSHNRLQGQTVMLTENESLQVERKASGGDVTVHRGSANPAAFVRSEQLPQLAEEQRLRPLRRWQAYSEQLRKDPALLAYYAFEAVERGNTKTLPNVSVAGSALDGQIEGAEWVKGRLPGKLALWFHGTGSGDKVVLPEQERFKFTGSFSLAVWFRVKRFTTMTHTLIAEGQSWQLHQDKRTKHISFDTSRDSDVDPRWDVTLAPTKVDDGRWHLAVSVFLPDGDVAHRLLYIDGRLAAEADSPAHFRQNDEPVWLGANSALSWDEFWGWIDEVAIFSRALSAREVAAMFEAGDPNGAAAGDLEPKKQKGGARH